MDFIFKGEVYKPSQDVHPPEDNELRENTTHPNLNSRDYMKRYPDNNTKIQKFYEILDINEEGHPVLGCNDYTYRIMNGSMWGFEDVVDIGSEEKAVYKLQSPAPVTTLQFLSLNMVILSNANYSIQVWSTYAEVRATADNRYCLFMVDEKNNHTSLINDIDPFKASKFQFISGSNDYTIKVWDTEGSDLSMVRSINAHSDSVTGVSTSHDDPKCFVSSSRDRTVSMWDLRKQRPAIYLYTKHNCAFNTVNWTNGNLIYAGDDSGHINIIDCRKPSTFLNSIEVFDYCSIHKMTFHGNLFGVCGHTNEIKVFDMSKDNEVVYTNSDFQNYVRDICWHTQKEEFYTVDWDGVVKTHVI